VETIFGKKSTNQDFENEWDKEEEPKQEENFDHLSPQQREL